MTCMTTTALIAVVEDDPAQRVLLNNALQTAGYDTILCASGEEFLAAAPGTSLMLLDVRLPGMDGLQVLEQVKRDRPGLPVILVTAYIDVRDAVRAIKAGAADYLEKPIDLDELIAVVDDLLRPDNGTSPDLGPGIVAESAAMRAVFDQAARVAPTETPVLILGESGVGKEVVARYLYERSPRAAGPLVVVDCTALPANLVESELFGHEKGAFTGAQGRRIGRFEEAESGTILLDEVGELPLDVQPKFLRVLESRVFRRVGGASDLPTDVRVIAATNRSLADEVERGVFRQDLFYRLNVFAITVPPLRARPEDILPLADLVLAPHRKRLSPAAERVLMHYAWPGNVRELRNALERAALVSSGGLILPDDLPPHLRNAPEGAGPRQVLIGDMKAIERQAILEALAKTRGNKTHAARLLGISRRNLIYKLRSFDVSEPEEDR